MCFSAQASFVAAVTLTAMGLAAARKADRSTMMLACIPLIFALQQLAEWFIWLGPDVTSFVPIAKNIFLLIAFVLWPLYTPLSLLMLEKEKKRRLLILACEAAGIMWALFALYHLSHGSAALVEDHIFYEFVSLREVPVTAILYVIATIAPLMISSHKNLKMLGAALALSFIASYLMWYEYFVSVWCFFAALLSIGIYFVVKYQEEYQDEDIEKSALD